MQASFSPDGSRFACVSDNSHLPYNSGRIEIWDASWRMEETQTALEEQQGIILSISLSPGGKFIASGSAEGLPWNSGSICLWNLLTGELVKNLKLSSRVESVAFSPVD